MENTENCDPKDALLSVCVVTERENDLHFPARGASKEGWGIVFWEKWKQSIFSHDNKRVESFKVHRVGEGDVVDVSLSEVGVLSFVLNGEERKNFPFPLPWGEALYPAVFAMVQGGEMGVEIEVDAPFNLKPPKT